MNLQTLDQTISEDVSAMATNWVESHAECLFNIAIGQLRDTHAAEKLVQGTFFAALKSQNNFSGRSSARTWLVETGDLARHGPMNVSGE